MTERDDRQDISDLLVRYATGIDRRDWPLFRTVFTDDCELDYGVIGAWTGVDAVTDFMQQTHAMAGHTLHRLTNQTITIDGNTAAARYLRRRADHGRGQSNWRQRHWLLRRQHRSHRRRLAYRPATVHRVRVAPAGSA